MNSLESAKVARSAKRARGDAQIVALIDPSAVRSQNGAGSAVAARETERVRPTAGEGNGSAAREAELVRPKVAVDTALFAMEGGRLKCYLVQLQAGALAGKWAFPGGLVRVGETLDGAARREIEDAAGLRDIYLEQVFSFGDPSRDPDAHVVSVA